MYSRTILFIGNPGKGKSTIANCLAETHLFSSGLSGDGKGVTYELQEAVHNGVRYFDTPGLSDVELRKAAAGAIDSVLRRGGEFQVCFVMTLEGNRIQPDDLTTVKLVLDAANQIPKNKYSIAINKMTEAQLRKLDVAAFTARLMKSLGGRMVTTDSILFFKELADLKDEENQCITLDDKTTAFFTNMPTFYIDPSKVQEVNADGWDEMESKLVSVSKDLEGALKQAAEEKAAKEKAQKEAVEAEKARVEEEAAKEEAQKEAAKAEKARAEEEAAKERERVAKEQAQKKAAEAEKARVAEEAAKEKERVAKEQAQKKATEAEKARVAEEAAKEKERVAKEHAQKEREVAQHHADQAQRDRDDAVRQARQAKDEAKQDQDKAVRQARQEAKDEAAIKAKRDQVEAVRQAQQQAKDEAAKHAQQNQERVAAHAAKQRQAELAAREAESAARRAEEQRRRLLEEKRQREEQQLEEKRQREELQRQANEGWTVTDTNAWVIDNYEECPAPPDFDAWIKEDHLNRCRRGMQTLFGHDHQYLQRKDKSKPMVFKKGDGIRWLDHHRAFSFEVRQGGRPIFNALNAFGI